MENLSPGLQFACQTAMAEAVRTRHQLVEPEHIFTGICKLVRTLTERDVRRLGLAPELAAPLQIEVGAVSSIFSHFTIHYVELYRQLRTARGRGTFQHPPESKPGPSAETEAVLEHAARLAGDVQAVTCVHFVKAMLADDESSLARLLNNAGPEFVAMKQGYPPGPPTQIGEPPPAAARQPRVTQPVPQLPAVQAAPIPFLQRFGRDLTALARHGRLRECIGRRNELLRLIQTLCRETKNNPLLLGDAGVGKTAIVEGLAWRVAQNKDAALAGKHIIQIHVADLLAGASQLGAFEERIQAIIREATQSPAVILFIDELHTLMGAGMPGVPLDAANMLKPALDRGTLRLIAATTVNEYRQHIEKDPAFERRFQPILVGEPTTEESVEILDTGYKARFEQKHRVAIEAPAIEAAVALTARYIPNRHLPDKAIDALDEACVRVSVSALSRAPSQGPEPQIVTGDTIAHVVSEWTGIPVTRLTANERERLIAMADTLKSRVIGQDGACDAVARAVQRKGAQLQAPGRPVGVFLFLGPTGVGKTELAKATAAFLFGTEKAMVRLDMSEYQEKHNVTRLIGAPPGYIGHDQEGQLTGALRRKPFSVVLLDEVDKAHPDVLTLFLQTFDDGRLTDSRGRTADASNALFIMTANIAQNLRQPMGFGHDDTQFRSREFNDELRRNFRPELLNRVTEIILFQSLQPEHIRAIAQLMLNDLKKRLQAQDINLEISESALDWLCRKGFDQQFGARPLRRLVERQIEDPMAGKILRGELKSGDGVTIDFKDGALEFAGLAGNAV